MADNSNDNRKGKVAAWVGTTAIIGAQGKAVQAFGGEAAKGFFTGMLSLMKPSNLQQLRAAPLPMKIATGAIIGGGLLAKRPLEGIKSLAEIGRDTVHKQWKDK